jgi:type I restriction enzyme S subunit
MEAVMTNDAALSDLCELIVDCPHSTPKWTDTGFLVLRSYNIRGGRLDLSNRSYTDEEHYKQRSRRAELRAGDLVITREAPMGEVCMIPLDLRCCLGQRMVLLRPDPKKCDGRFLLYAIQSPSVQNQISWSEGTGSTVSNLRIPHLEALRIPTPMLTEQRVIADVLSALDDKIEQNRRTGRTLEKLARATFKAWFMDFEPVKAKADGLSSFPGMSDAAFAALPNRLMDSPRGAVPQGWTVRSLNEVVDINPPRRLSKGQDAPYLDMKNMPTDGHAPDAWERRPHGSGMRFINGDTLVARITPCLENGKTAYVDFLGDGEVAWGSTEYIVLRPKAPLPGVYAYCLARTSEFREFAIQNMTGTSGRQRVSASALNHYHVAVPDAVTAAAFGDVILPLFQCIRACKAESSKLGMLRDYLLPRLLSGAIRVESKGAL